MNILDKLLKIIKKKKREFAWLVKISHNYIYTFNNYSEFDINIFKEILLNMRILLNTPVLLNMPVLRYNNNNNEIEINIDRLYLEERTKTIEGDINVVLQYVKKFIWECQHDGEEILRGNELDVDFLDFYFALIYLDPIKKDLLEIVQVFNPKDKNHGRLIVPSFIGRKNEKNYMFWDDFY